MATHEATYHRIHPIPPPLPSAVESPPSGDPPPSNHKPPSAPPPPMKPRKPNTRCMCKCVCWTLVILLILAVAVAASAATIYLVFKPKVPKYSVDSLRLSDLNLNVDLSLTAKFDVRVTASNPNDKIGIYYESGGVISVWYSGTDLCRGRIPKFYQGHRNVTRLRVGLAGRNRYGNALMSAIQQQQTTGRIPLVLKIHAPVAVKLGALKMRKVKVLGNCDLVVDRLSLNNRINIKASDCKFKLKL